MVTPWITQTRPIQDGEEVRAAIEIGRAHV